ncbi:unnamed protein product [Adineta steineri]|uniref:Uncharacterized protein n=1 Tax=Adineta steineri TaxID=433720 RepID=A0A815S1V8_9BILA|nr:unnamed protein product [Adineta steineri]CAF3959018.1 unnamed protein product [Adineta steineri]
MYGTSAIGCMECPYIELNITVDTKINMDECKNTDAKFCVANLRLNYVQQNESFAQFLGSPTEMLLLSNGAPVITHEIFIWLNKFYVNYLANAICFSSTSCGVDDIQRAYAEMRTFDFVPIQEKLATRLYGQPTNTLKCANEHGDSVECKDGFCLVVSDGNGVSIGGSCVPKGIDSNPAGVTITKAMITIPAVTTQTAVSYACNKDMCNSKETVQEILQMLADSKLIDQPQFPTVPPTESTSVTSIGTTTHSAGEKLQLTTFFIVFVSLFLITIGRMV